MLPHLIPHSRIYYLADTSKLNVKPEIPMRIKSSGVKTQATHNVTTTSSARIEDKPSSSDSRPKEGSLLFFFNYNVLEF